MNIGDKFTEEKYSDAIKSLEGIDGTIIEVEPFNGKRQFQLVKIDREEELKQKKLCELENWFNNYFERQLIQSIWQTNFIISYDKYFNCSYGTIDELKAKAEEVRNKIKILRDYT